MKQNPFLTAPSSDYYDGVTLGLAESIRSFDLERSRSLISESEILLLDRGSKDMPLALYAAACGNMDALELLLQEGADPNDTFDFGGGAMSLLAIAVGSEDERFMRVLLKWGANPNGVEGTEPPICTTILGQRWDRMKLLLEHGANVDQADPMGKTPIMLLAQLNHYDKVLELLGKGADPYLKTNGGRDLISIINANPLDTQSTQGKNQQRVLEVLRHRAVR